MIHNNRHIVHIEKLNYVFYVFKNIKVIKNEKLYQIFVNTDCLDFEFAGNCSGKMDIGKMHCFWYKK